VTYITDVNALLRQWSSEQTTGEFCPMSTAVHKFRVDYVAFALLAFSSVAVWAVLFLQVAGVIDSWFD
jgi:hypothetical protein